MKSIVCHGYLQQPVTLLMGEVEKMHRGIVHAHHQLDTLCLMGIEKIMVHRRLRYEYALAEVKIVARLVVIEVGVEAEEPAEAHQENKVEVGEVFRLAVEPLDAARDIVIERLVALFGAQGMVQEFCDKKGDGEFVGIERYRTERDGRLDIFKLL